MICLLSVMKARENKYLKDLDTAVAESIVSFVNQADSNDEMLKAFEEKIHMKGVKIRGETPSDGNCLFWAISDQMDRINKDVYTHTQIRRMVVDHIKNISDDEKSELAKFIPDDDLPTYLQKMADTGTYGDHICLEKLANILECKIRVVHADTQDVFIGNKEDTLLLGFIPELQHYTSLEFRFQSDDYVAVRLEEQRRKKSQHIAKVIQVDSKTDEVQLQIFAKGWFRGREVQVAYEKRFQLGISFKHHKCFHGACYTSRKRTISEI